MILAIVHDSIIDIGRVKICLKNKYSRFPNNAVAKGVITNSNQLHICYCHTPIRYTWNLYYQYLIDSGLTKGIEKMLKNLVKKDLEKNLRNL